MATRSTDAPSYQVIVHETAEAELADVPDPTRTNLKDTIAEASRREQPTTHPDARPMRDADNIFRLREGKYRALCDLSKPHLRVLLVEHRETVYSRTSEALDRRQ